MQKYVDEIDHPTLTQDLDRVIDDQLPDLEEVSSSDSDDEWSYKWVPGGYYGYPGRWIHYSWSMQMLRTMGAVFWTWRYDDGH